MSENGEYWRQRFELLEQSQNQRGEQCQTNIERQYRHAQKQLEGQIAAWYQRFADNNKITLAEARKMLTGRELAEFKWDVNDYIRYGEENAINGAWCKQLENASARYHISRLESLKIQTQQSLEVLFGNQLDSIDSTMRNIYTSGYYHTAFEIQKGVGVGWNFATLDDRQISKVINNPWTADGKNFSERVWGNRQKLVNELNTALTQNIILGKDPQKAINEIARKMNTSKNNAGRLVMTEEAFFSSAAQKDSFNELDVKQFEIVATLDSLTSEICQGLDGHVEDMVNYEPNVTAPPFHCWCRSTTAPYFDDNFDFIGERAARGADGKVYYVPADMTYSQWEQTFVNGGDKSVLSQVPQINDKKIKIANESFEKILIKSESTPHTDKMLLYNGATEYQLNNELSAPFAYNRVLDTIQYNPLSPDYQLYDMNYVQAHELTHRMDILEYNSYNNQDFVNAISKSKNVAHNNADTISDWFNGNRKYENSFAMSDIISALTNNEILVPIGHSNSYWSDEQNVAMEIFANISAMDVLQDSALDDLKILFVELFNAYRRVIE